MKELSLDQVGKRLRRIRSQMEMTREQFAEQVGISPQFLAEIENGKKGMSTETLFKICNRFNLSADYILMGKTSSAQLSDPVQTTLNHFPKSYIELTEEIIRAIEKVVKAK
ncbi:MAG: helix-turn-helix domain-containing protein [Clostridia bacterium]